MRYVCVLRIKTWTKKKKISEIEGYEGRGCIFAGYCNFNRKNFFNQTRIERYFC